VLVTLTDFSGKQLLNEPFNVPAGTSTLNIRVKPGWSSGVYVLLAAGGALNKTMRAVLVK